MIPYGRQTITDADVAAVCDALRDELLTQGPRVAQFEERFADRVGAAHAVAFNSGTAALHAAYFAAGIEKGASVLTSPITFAATTNASLYLGGGAHFADIEDATVLVDATSVDDVDDADIRVLAPVHFGGQVADMEMLSAIAHRRGWIVVEDAAHALGARYRDRSGSEHLVGACVHSDMCCFSFHAVKHITTGEGGAVTTNDRRIYRALLRFRTHGMTRDPEELLGPEGAWFYEQHDLGFNYRITDFQCALGLSQLAHLDAFVARRRQIAGRYDAELGRIEGVRLVEAPTRSCGSYHLYVIRVSADRRRSVFDALRAAGIGVNVHYIPVYRHPYYRRHGFTGVSFPRAERYYSEAITVPLHHGMTDDEVSTVIHEVRRQAERAVA